MDVAALAALAGSTLVSAAVAYAWEEARGYDSGRRCALEAEGEQVPGRRAAWTRVEAADSWDTASVTSQRSRSSPLGAGSGCHEHQSGLAAARHAAAYRMRCPSCSIRSATCCTCAA